MMLLEGALLDKKSLRPVIGKSSEGNESAKVCVAFACSKGSQLLIAFNQSEERQVHMHRISTDFPSPLRRKTARRNCNNIAFSNANKYVGGVTKNIDQIGAPVEVTIVFSQSDRYASTSIPNRKRNFYA